MAHGSVTDEELAGLIRRTGEANSALMRGDVGGLPDQDWSLRVTQVYRREGSEWRLVHRHADPLVKGISVEQAAAIARG
jgi:hypothetical protein